MLFVTGPLYSGKRTFSQKFGGRQICDVQNLAANATDLEKLADELATYDVVIATEIGGGIVPIDPAERAAREVLFFDGVPACTSAGATLAAAVQLLGMGKAKRPLCVFAGRHIYG